MSNKPPASGTDLTSTLELLYSAVLADVLDSLGYRHQALPAHIRPLTPAKKICGRIFPAMARATYKIPAKPYELEIAAVDALACGDVLVVDAGEDHSCAFWGELLTTACIAKGARGVVMTACTRDMWKIRDLNFPVYGIGWHPGDSKGRLDVLTVGEPITIGGVRARHGDWLLGDEDGVVLIPQAVAPEAIRLAQEKVSGENVVREELARGVPVGEAFRKYGIL